MAYMDQKRKNTIAPQVKQILAKYGVRGSLSVRHHSTLVLTLGGGKIDFCRDWYDLWIKSHKNDPVAYVPDHVPDHLDINTHHIASQHTGEARACLLELLAAMQDGNWDRSDSQTDYWDVGWWCDIRVGKWDKPYVVS